MTRINIQPIEKREFRDDGKLDIHSIFPTIQGEGPFTGQPAVFVRLAGCNLQCPLCDTDYTQGRKLMTVSEIVDKVQDARICTDLVVITGGEPFRQDIETLVRTLVFEGYRVQIETNGTLAPPSESFLRMCKTDITEQDGCFIVCSPKSGKVNGQLAPYICAYKYVIKHGNMDETGLPITALDHSASPHVAHPPTLFMGPIYVQPADEKDEKLNELNLKACIASVIRHGYTLQLQVHKIINME